MNVRGAARRSSAVVALSVALLAGASVWFRRVRRAVGRARAIPFSPLTAKGRVGAEYLRRHGVATGDPLSGEMDDMSAYARPDFDPEAIHPAVRRFYERTAEYDLSYRVTWHRGFRLGAALAARLTSRIEQLDLPGPWESATGTLTSRIVAVDAGDDPRDGARAWIRTNESGAAVFVAIYASHVRDGTRYVNIAAPLPRSNLSTVLSVRPLDRGDEPPGIELTTKTETGDEGLYFVTSLGSVALPIHQSFRVWPDEDGVRARHEMWLFGRRFLTVEYESRDGTTATYI
ncbi:hypothetical protein [Haladaptatus salinisoli]|uniref:hypothetical protein n=1 Tax=Haladaptatus salinisoli TaxID=2884876 RepID=UPI001D0A508A|nr:hypothetical protein [Haladaptatus salinisoli]